MTDSNEVISAFLDDETFEPEALGEALADPAGRELLIDLIVLRHVVQSADSVPARAVTHRKWPLKKPLRAALAAASLILAIAAGYVVGGRRTGAEMPETPMATRVIQPTTSWAVKPTASVVAP